MATTTNYGWTTPDDTALVKDGASAIRTLGTSVDTTTKNLNPSTTLGDIEYRSSTANTNTRLGIGSTGNVLTVAGGVPTWAAPAASGKVLQVVQAVYNTSTSNATITYADTGLSATITPSSASSRVLCMLFHPIRKTSGSATSSVRIRLVKTATTIHQSADNLYTGTAIQVDGSYALSYVDSPATTSATTYKSTFANSAAAADAVVQVDGRTAVLILMEIGA